MTGRRPGVGLLLATLGVPAVLAGQQSPLDGYVAEGLSRNLSLVEQRLVLARADALVREARGRWLPSLTLLARYSERSGEVLDLGDLVNPAYRALNQVTGTRQFPTDLHLTLPYRQETGLRLTQPLFLPAASAGIAAARHARDGERAVQGALRRRVAAGIRLAYLDLVRADRVVDLHRATLELLQENLRVTQSRLDHGAATPDVVLRARADVSEGEQRLSEGLQQVDAAREAFNLLLERPLEAGVELVPDSLLVPEPLLPLDSAVAVGLRDREELRQLEAGIQAAGSQVRLATAAFLPSLVLAVDYGFHGDSYRFTGDRDALIASLVFEWNLFRGGQDRARRDAGRLDVTRLGTERALTRRRIELEIRTSWRAAATAGDARVTAADRLTSAEQSYRLVERQYREGAVPQVTLIDARTSYTAARLNLILTTYDYFARTVELERAAALYPAPRPAEGGRQ